MIPTSMNLTQDPFPVLSNSGKQDAPEHTRFLTLMGGTSSIQSMMVVWIMSHNQLTKHNLSMVVNFTATAPWQNTDLDVCT
mmetsp:Transcript_48700/g.86664  ORF Transcript_48700/g.86664 Transcript_48700/m.86664 type:complete len:81 (-) Transcript_48700:550-792(-)